MPPFVRRTGRMQAYPAFPAEISGGNLCAPISVRQRLETGVFRCRNVAKSLCAAGLCGPVLGAELGGGNTAPGGRMARRRGRGQTGLDIPGGVRKRNRRGLWRLRFAWLSGKATGSATAGRARLAHDERPQTNPLGPPASGASGADRRGCPARRPAARSAPARPCIHPNALRACAARRALPLAALLNRRSRLLSGLPAPLRGRSGGRKTEAVPHAPR